MTAPSNDDRRMEPAASLEVAIAPMRWLERSRGWRRRGLAFLYLVIGLGVGILGWRELSLWRLPNAPEPFDLAKFGRVEVLDADNAMVAYREVFARMGNLDATGYGVPAKGWTVSDWSMADPEVRRWAEDHQKALEPWLTATDRPDSLMVQPESMEMSTRMEPVQTLRSYVRLALLEGSRLEQAGDLESAWKYYRASLRASRHAGRHGGTVQRIIGFALLRNCRPRVEGWSANPSVTPAQLRRAIADVEACAAMTPPASEMVRVEYFSARAALKLPELWDSKSDWGPYADTDWTNHVGAIRWCKQFLHREPERTARVLRLITAGYLAQADRPGPLRPKLIIPEFMIYGVAARTPAVVRSIRPEELDAWARSSAMGSVGNYGGNVQSLVDAEPGTFDNLRIRMAERAFAIERGRPPKTYGELLGPYLKALPDGVEPGDQTHAGLPPAGP